MWTWADLGGSITRVYASNQKDEHQRYKSIYDQNAEEFAMVEQMQRYVRAERGGRGVLMMWSVCVGMAFRGTHGITVRPLIQ